MEQASSPTNSDFLVSLLPLLIIIAIAYFVIIRPIRTRMQRDNLNFVQAVPSWLFLVVGFVLLFLAVEANMMASENELAAAFSEEARGAKAAGQVFGMAFGAIGVVFIAAAIFKGFLTKRGNKSH